MISFHEQESIFHISSPYYSYIFSVSPEKILIHHHYGKPILEPFKKADLIEFLPIELGSSTTICKTTTPVNLNHIACEIATYGKGDYREPTIHLRTKDGFRSLDFRYHSYEIIHDLHFENIPQSKKDETLRIILKEAHFDITLHLNYSVCEDALIRNIELINGELDDLVLERMHSATFDFYHRDFTLITLDGAWIRERHIHERELDYGIIKIDSKKGVSSSDHNPLFILKGKTSTSNHGEAYGFNLIYSGGFEALIEVNPHQLTRINYGINSFDFYWNLSPHEKFITPEIVSIYSQNGVSGVSEHMHRFVRKNLSKNNKNRPIMFNNWEATYFDFNTKKLLKLARKAALLGMEGFCLDDGWFGKRNDDTTSLGDWETNLKKLPGGLRYLSKKIKKLGLKFGIWVEPEMINEQSELYQLHPEWVIKHPHIKPALGRNQMVLDLSVKAVKDYLFTKLSNVFIEGEVDYVKWDMNRNLSDLYSTHLLSKDQGKLSHLYVLGLYELLERLKNAFPEVLFESCASGGNRFDLGMHYYMPQGWVSDNTDAYERIKIQKGTLLGYPLSTMSNHINDEVAHQTLRAVPLETRFNVALFGILGYELDLKRQSYFTKRIIAMQTTFYKQYRTLCQYGTLHDLSVCDDDSRFLVVSEDKNLALLGLFQGLNSPNPTYQNITLKGLNPDINYRITSRIQYENLRRFGSLISHALPIKLAPHGILFTLLSNRYLMKCESFQTEISGNNLLAHGLKLPYRFTGSGYHDQMRIMGDFSSRLYIIEAIPSKES